jgi:FtsH-binding integral membrane protein
MSAVVLGLFAALWVLLIWGFVISIFGYKQSFLYSLFGAFVFALYILFDTSLIMQRLSYDEYVLGAISLYLDILNLFIFLLDLLGRRCAFPPFSQLLLSLRGHCINSVNGLCAVSLYR